MTPSQADRDAAADFLEGWEPGPEMTVVKLARAFAAHRRAALEEAALRLDREWPGPASKIVRALIDKEPT